MNFLHFLVNFIDKIVISLPTIHIDQPKLQRFCFFGELVDYLRYLNHSCCLVLELHFFIITLEWAVVFNYQHVLRFYRTVNSDVFILVIILSYKMSLFSFLTIVIKHYHQDLWWRKELKLILFDVKIYSKLTPFIWVFNTCLHLFGESKDNHCCLFLVFMLDSQEHI